MIEFTTKEMEGQLPMERVIDLMRDAFRIISSGEAVCPVRLNMPIAERDACNLSMPCYLPGSGYFGIKTVNVFPMNREHPVINSIYHFYSAETGILLATMDGTLLTKLRTGAASGLASDLLAAKDASVLAVFGTGPQAETQVEAVCCVRDIREVLVFSRDRDRAENFADRAASICSAEVRFAADLQDLKCADIICTATPSLEPLFSPADVKPGALINAIGSYRPEMCEIPVGLIASSRVYVDEMESALEESGELIQAIEAGLMTKSNIVGELGECLDREPDQMKNERDEITIFKSVGNALQDFVCAKDLFERANPVGSGA